MKNELELNINKEELKALDQKLVIGERVEEEKLESSLDFNKLTEEEKKAVESFIDQFDVTNTNMVIGYGANAQNKISKFSDDVLDNVKTKDTGKVGDLLTDLTVEIKSLKVDLDAGLKPGLFSSLKKKVDRLIARYNKVQNNVEVIEKELEKHKLQMMKDIELFDQMYDKNLEYFQELSLYIIAGYQKLEQMKNDVLPEMQKKAEESGDQTDIQELNDMRNMLNRFEKKLYDLKTTRIISIQMAPQIRLIQNNDAELVDKIQSSIINTIPLWKNQMVIALGISNAKKALEAQEKVTDLTNEMLKKNSEMLKQGSIDIAKQSERAIVDLDTLKKTNDDLMTTLDEIVKIHEEGRAKRTEAEVELERIEHELKEKLLEMKK